MAIVISSQGFKRKGQLFWVAILVLVNLGLSWPLVKANSNYFYQEDDAHHFNRVIEMAQRRDLNPRYFNKPALHFYLRMPIVYASAAWEEFRGRLGSLAEVRTRSPYGLATYALSASHPAVVVWSRLESVVWNALLAVLVFTMLRAAALPTWVGLAGAAITSLSPEALRNSYVIGVDTLMALLCFICSAYAVRAVDGYTRGKLLVTGLIAGLSCAAKYNAAPIILVPYTLWLIRDRHLLPLVVVSIGITFGFLLGAPYSVLSFQDFWSGLSYEVWHYGVAGHEEHTNQPGLPQAWFYLRWLATDGIGLIASLLLLPGLYTLYRANKLKSLVLMVFPAAYALLMIMQKANFTRNMVVMVPYASVAAAYGLITLTSFIRHAALRRIVLATILFVMLRSLWMQCDVSIFQQQTVKDSRDGVCHWLTSSRPLGSDVAVAGQLQLPFSALALPGVDSFDMHTTSLPSLVQAGYAFFIVPANNPLIDARFTETERDFEGASWPQRVPRNPAITILRVRDSALEKAAEFARADLELNESNGKLFPRCSSQEPHCWISSLITQVQLPLTSTATTFEAMSPWPNQTLDVLSENEALIHSVVFKTPGTWTVVRLPPYLSDTTRLRFRLSQVHSPASQGASRDARRLGLAIKRQ